MNQNEAQPPHILIVDDDPDQLCFLVAALRNTPYRVSVALDGDQGYVRATVLLPDLILLDVQMPGRNGLTAASLLKVNAATQHIPILFLSAANDPHTRLAGLRAGAVDYIKKPFHVDEVVERARIHFFLSQKKTPSITESRDANNSGDDEKQSNLAPVNLMLKQLATKFIFYHISDSSLKSSNVAASLEVSMLRLNTVFEAYDGMFVFEFIRQERMRRAVLMLGQSTLAIANIAREVDYSNSANFATEFRKFWEKSPTQPRNEAQSNADALQHLISSKFK